MALTWILMTAPCGYWHIGTMTSGLALSYSISTPCGSWCGYAYHHASSHYFDKSGIHDNHLAYLAFSFLQVTKFFSAKFRDPRMSGKVCQQYDHEVPSCWGPHLQDSMKELLSVGIRSWHFMAIDMLSTVFMSIVHQQCKVGKPYRNPKHTAMQWK